MHCQLRPGIFLSALIMPIVFVSMIMNNGTCLQCSPTGPVFLATIDRWLLEAGDFVHDIAAR